MARDIFMGGQMSNYATWDSHMQVMTEPAIRYNYMILSPSYVSLNRDFPTDFIYSAPALSVIPAGDGVDYPDNGSTRRTSVAASEEAKSAV